MNWARRLRAPNRSALTKSSTDLADACIDDPATLLIETLLAAIADVEIETAPVPESTRWLVPA